MKLAILATVAALSIAATGQQATAQTFHQDVHNTAQDVRHDTHKAHVAVDHAIKSRHRTCTIRHHHKVCSYR
jgi:hypothetical protein